MQASIRERLIGAAGSAIVVTLFGYLLLLGLTVATRIDGEPTLTLLELALPALLPPPRQPHVVRPKLARASGKASPRNLRNKATEIVAPPAVPVIVPPVIASAKAGAGIAASTGASDRPGPGEGAGGEGDGTGSGGEGAGDGDYTPPRQIGGRLKSSDLPPDLWVEGGRRTVAVHYSVKTDGRVSDCRIMATSGSAALDQLTCRLIEQRFRFRPSRDADGRPVRSAIEERQGWFTDPREDAPPPP